MSAFISLCLLSVAAAATDDASARRPNILFLIADEMRADCLGVAGHPIVKTPALDKLAQRGVRFTRAYAASPVCSPDRAVLFTGRYPHINRVTRNQMPFAEGEVVLPQLLRKNGYVTGMVGKLHLHHKPDWFDHQWITAQGNGQNYRAFLRKHMPEFKGGPSVATAPGKLITYGQRSPLKIGTSALPERLWEETWIADTAIDFIKQHKDSTKPWFLFVSMVKPHSPFVVPEPYASMYKPQDMAIPKSFDKNAKPPAGVARARHFINDPEILQQVIAHYYGAVTFVDRQMGRVIDTLAEQGLSDNTIVLFTADHGNMLGQRNRMFKGLMYEPSVAVPQILNWPGKIEGGAVNTFVHDHTAIMPTLLELAGIPVPAGIQGKSLVPVLTAKNVDRQGVAFAVLSHRMVATNEWKLIDPYEMKDAQPELYHIGKDPLEQNNLYGQPEAATVQKQLEDALRQWWNEKPPPVR